MFTPHCKQGDIKPRAQWILCNSQLEAATKQDLLYSNTPFFVHRLSTTTVTMVLEDSEGSVFELDITVSSDMILLISCCCICIWIWIQRMLHVWALSVSFKGFWWWYLLSFDGICVVYCPATLLCPVKALFKTIGWIFLVCYMLTMSILTTVVSQNYFEPYILTCSDCNH